MPADDSALTTRYALRVALIYLVIRSLPILLLYIINALPAETYLAVVENHGPWLAHFYPVMPVWLMSLPVGFQEALVLFPVLMIEVLLVFLLSTWFLRRRPWVVHSGDRRRWVLLVLAILIWSFGVRHQVLAQVQSAVTAELLAGQDEAGWLEALPFLLIQAHWKLAAVFYATALLWAWLPVWLHFRFARKAAGATIPDSPDAGGASGLSRSVVFASFLLGCLLLHFALVQSFYLGLWPWLAGQVRAPLDGFDEAGLPLILSQILFATLVCALAAWVYTRRFVAGAGSAVWQGCKVLLAGSLAEPGAHRVAVATAQ